MRSKTKHIRFFTWFFIALFVIFGAGLYFWSEEKYETRAGTTANAPETSNTRASTGLASHWTFDREHISGTSITDRVGSNTGTSSGSPTAAIGKFGQGLDFDASDDHVNVTSAASIDIDATEDFSIAGWFTRDTFASDHTIVAKRNGQADTDDGYIIYIDDTTDQLIFEVSDTSDADEYSVASNAAFTASGWHHFVVVWDQDSAIGTEIYIDGAANGTDTGTIANVGDLTEAVAFRIGSESDGGNRFDGKLDDIRFYSATLSASDVYQLSTAGKATVNASLDDPLSQGLRGYWKLDEGTGTSTTADASGNANTLSMTGPPTWTTGTIGPYAMDFSGSGQYLSVASPASGVLDFAAGASFSITGWFDRDTFTTDHTIVAKRNGQTATDDGYIVYIDDATDTLVFEASDTADTDEYQRVSSSAFTATGWHQFAVSWNDSATTDPVNIFIDGAINNGTATGTFANMGSLVESVAFRIGAESDAGVPFDGKLDDIRVYGSALSADEVAKLYQTTAPTQPVDTGLVGHWTFDGPDIQGTTAIDRSGKGNNGTITGTTKTIGKLGQGMSFDGSGDYVDAGDTSSLNLTSSFSISSWVKGNSFPGGYRYQLLSKGVRGAGSYFLFVDVADYSGGDQRFKFGFTEGGSWNTVDSTTVVATSTWWHVVGVFDNSANTLKVYINGVLSGTTTGVTATPASTSGTDLTIGAYEDGNYEYIDGAIDDARIYNRALSADEVSNLYDLGK